jgi:hypothetical protein
MRFRVGRDGVLELADGGGVSAPQVALGASELSDFIG